MNTPLSVAVREWLDAFDRDPGSITVFQNGREWVPMGDELPAHFVALVKDRCLRLKATADKPRLPDVTLTALGKPFRCECGCNVFKSHARGKYICNGCEASYTGEPN